eukprot:58392-Hanusia_phi.AAC.2
MILQHSSYAVAAMLEEGGDCPERLGTRPAVLEIFRSIYDDGEDGCAAEGREAPWVLTEEAESGHGVQSGSGVARELNSFGESERSGPGEEGVVAGSVCSHPGADEGSKGGELGVGGLQQGKDLPLAP